ncbi:hypothetical protein INH39_01695 [Massilia violaceinigra]|uniref:HicB-like antitoxin of toxin-antitoxin system domain-containing protein n=1 Tax=Massilia violaceinigra TaxID=2045208 RepID=A0ABY4A919_9BURK|nr:type II toxin-antitoxin system HicB family antitoxin [Massilia violaceinigra]UOD30489.1 hypothetical protein INH39_01695 [Massilia violaceinigra]
MDNFDASAYNISIVRRPVDGHLYFVGTVKEFPHIKVYEDSWAASYQALQAIIEDLFAESNELGEAFPAPFSEDAGYSGRVTIQLPKWLHARLDSQANIEEVSLSSHIVTLLTIASTNRAYALPPLDAPLSKAEA